ncbi:MAG: FAD-dependent pyridine nucleotide-disulfide oxidoreductase [Candidatus Aminicenantes bacterium]|nr:FAD-dependent pyridine nucleotide-disulfide oxidoreductase [Candidatus Aminicenantes bacterium]
MRAVIIGNGLAGTMAAKTLRELDSQVEIVVFAEEKYPYYPRPNLIEYVAGKLPYERIFAFSEEWHVRQKIDIRLGTPVRRIHPQSGEVELDGGRREPYDTLLVANGASSFVPPIKGSATRGVFSLRTLDDAKAILDSLRDHRRVVVIGGGLLGLEIARAVRSQGAEVEVVEFFDRLLPRQLDVQGASLLRSQVESLGIRVRLGVTTEEILGPDEITGIRLKGGAEISADMAVVAAGVRPNLDLPRDAGLAADRGLVVDDRLRTSHPRVFAAGDGIQHRGKVYGIIPASFDQARAAAYNMLGQEKKYEGTIPANTLKVVGLYVTSLGLATPEGQGYEEIRKIKKEEGIYKKVVLQDGVLVGAIWIGTKKGISEIARAVTAKIKVNQWINTLLDDSFDFSVL